MSVADVKTGNNILGTFSSCLARVLYWDTRSITSYLEVTHGDVCVLERGIRRTHVIFRQISTLQSNPPQRSHRVTRYVVQPGSSIILVRLPCSAQEEYLIICPVPL